MTLTHDPEFPFVLVDQAEKPYAKFASRVEADTYFRRVAQSDGSVVDTTPKPTIPEEEHAIIFYVYPTPRHEEPNPIVFLRYGHPGNKVWQRAYAGDRWTEEKMLDEYGTEYTLLANRESNKDAYGTFQAEQKIREESE